MAFGSDSLSRLRCPNWLPVERELITASTSTSKVLETKTTSLTAWTYPTELNKANNPTRNTVLHLFVDLISVILSSNGRNRHL